MTGEEVVTLDDLSAAIPRVRVIGRTEGRRTSGIEIDHRFITPGDIFAALPGAVTDGRFFIREALAAGASAVLTPVEVPFDIPQFVVEANRLRHEVARVASLLNGQPSKRLGVIGVTGTNGKTTVVHLLSQALGTMGHICREIGTLWGRLTTPEAPTLQGQLRRFVDEGAEFAAIEVSSIALDMCRTDFVDFDITIFTNLSQDHLDIHGDMERYFAAKSKLFATPVRHGSVINRDDAYGRRLLESLRTPEAGIGLSDISSLELSSDGMRFEYRGVGFAVPLIGAHNLENVMSAVRALELLNFDLPAIADSLREVEEPRGRLEFIECGQPFSVVVDYAHTPAALEAVLQAVRLKVEGDGRLTVLFGCGGDRDSLKRPEMGRVAGERADLIVVANDNPRSEDPEAIAAEVVAGIPVGSAFEVILDRRLAIRRAISLARPGDVVVIAGKGHEQRQIVDGHDLAFDDAAVAREALLGTFMTEESAT